MQKMISENLPFSRSQSTLKSLLRWFALVGWVAASFFHLTLLTLDLIRDYPRIITPCDGEAGFFGTCGEQLALSWAEIAVLESWGFSLQGYAIYMLSFVVVCQIIYLGMSLFFLWNQGLNPFGFTLALFLVVIPSTYYGSDIASVHPNLGLPAQLFTTLITFIQIAFLYLIPNGRFSPRWAYIPFISTFIFFILLSLSVGGFPLPDWLVSIINPVIVGLLLLGIGFQVYRYLITSDKVERQQTKWIIVGVVILVLTVFVWVLTIGGGLRVPSGRPLLLSNIVGWTILYIGQYLFGVFLLIAVVRYRLWNIDIIISRTLIYGGLTLMIVAIYSITVGGFALLFQSSGSFFISLIATGIIAVIFQPVRERLQRWVNRLIFGERDDPYTVISQLNQSLQATAVPQETLTTISQTIADMLKLPHVDIELTDDNVQVGRASVGQPVGTPLKLPLTYQQESVGRITVSPRTPNEPFNPQEQQLLADIAAQIGPVASATRLTMALQRSRENLVLAREEERRRIRRDLHDGLGPTLASQTLKLDSVLELLDEEDANTASQHVAELKGQTQQMVADIRRLVYELRPPALDELGLLEALRAHFSAGSNGQLAISIGADPEPLPDLPAAIEVAAYRTILEAVTNVIKHAKGRHCTVQLAIHETSTVSNMHVTVTDDGIGLPNKRKVGVGLVSMRERAEELGGRFKIESNQAGGTIVTTIFPFVSAQESKRRDP